MNNKTVLQRIFEIRKKIADKKIWKFDEAKLNSKGFSYRYRSFHNLMSKIAPLLNKQNLHPVFDAKPLGDSLISERTIYFYVILKITATDNDTIKPFEISSPAVGEDKNDLSKALGKAFTYAKRYLLLNTFSLSDDEVTVEQEAENELQKTAAVDKGGFKKVSR